MNILSKVAVIVLSSGLLFSSTVVADSAREEAMATCENEAIENDVTSEGKADFILGCMIDMGFNTTADSEETMPQESDSSEERG